MGRDDLHSKDAAHVHEIYRICEHHFSNDQTFEKGDRNKSNLKKSAVPNIATLSAKRSHGDVDDPLLCKYPCTSTQASASTSSVLEEVNTHESALHVDDSLLYTSTRPSSPTPSALEEVDTYESESEVQFRMYNTPTRRISTKGKFVHSVIDAIIEKYGNNIMFDIAVRLDIDQNSEYDTT